MLHALHVVAELPQFLRDVAAAKIAANEHRLIVDAIAVNPLQGTKFAAPAAFAKSDLPVAAKEKVEATAS